MLCPLVESLLVASGKDVIDLGICPTPTVGITIRDLHAAGGIAITASHNPIEYNGLKFLNAEGVYFTQEDNNRLKNILDNEGWINTGVEGIGSKISEGLALEWHMDKVIQSLEQYASAYAQEAPHARVRKAVVDCCNAAASEIAPALLERLGHQVVPLFTDTTKLFPREAEPLPQHLGALGEAVRRHKADIGFAIDPDADRLSIVDETGKPIGEERTLILAVDAFLSTTKCKGYRGPFVVNLSCSMANDDVARKHGVEILRTPIGEANVVSKMQEINAPIGGEGNGGVIFPEIHPGRDAATAMAWILAALQQHGGPISALNATIPTYEVVRQKIPLGQLAVEKALQVARELFPDADSIDDIDGLKFNWSDRWFHIRPSNTEPIIRATVEASTHKEAQAIMERAIEALGA